MSYSVFAIEVALPFDAQSHTRNELRRLILEHPEQTSYAQKAGFYGMVTDTLLREAASFERGCWDYFDDPSIAEGKYDEWCGGMLNEEGVRQTPSIEGGRGPYRASGEVRYMTFTIAFLLVNGSNTDQTLSSFCNIGQQNLWQRNVFVHLLRSIRMLNFASIRSDVVYMIPNNDDYGLTVEDLQQPKFEYLRPLV